MSRSESLDEEELRQDREQEKTGTKERRVYP